MNTEPTTVTREDYDKIATEIAPEGFTYLGTTDDLEFLHLAKGMTVYGKIIHLNGKPTRRLMLMRHTTVISKHSERNYSAKLRSIAIPTVRPGGGFEPLTA